MKKRLIAGTLLSTIITGASVTAPFMAQMSYAGESNSAVLINEVNSSPDDWVELINTGSSDVDLSGYEIRDNSDDHRWKFPTGTVIKAGGRYVADAHDNGLIYSGSSYTEGTFETAIGIGSGDSIRLYDNNGVLLDQCSWEKHASYNGDTALASIGRYPEGTGELQVMKETKNAPNELFEDKSDTPSDTPKTDEPETINWPGPDEVKTIDKEAMFLKDSSGLDFHNGQLYAVDNGTGKFWIMDVSKDGNISFASGFENGKRVRFQKDAADPDAAGPDTEGITVDGKGLVYVAAERDNSAKNVNNNTVLMVDPNADGEDLTALKEWNLTSSLPQVKANMGIESVEWVSAEDISSKLTDKNTGSIFDIADYPNAYSGGIFFVALEDNGHVYAYVLNEDGSSVQIADIDSKLGGAMGLDYDKYEKCLWVAADNGFGNKSAKITFNGSENPDINHVLPASGVDVTANNEGFAVADADYTVDGARPVFRFNDGVESGALTEGYLYCDYTADSVSNSEDTDKNNNGNEDNTYVDKESVNTYQDNADNANNANNENNENKTDNVNNAYKADNAVGSPKTGDNNGIILYIILLSAVGGAISVMLVRRLHKAKEN